MNISLKMKRTLRIFALLVMAAAGMSCMKSKLEATYNKQEDQIDRYLSSKQDMRVERNGCANRLVTVEGEGEQLTRTGFVSFYYAGYTFSGSYSTANMFVTNHQASAEQAGWNLTDAEYTLYETHMADAKLIQGLKDGLVGVRAGEECEILFTGKFGFGNENFGIIPANSALLYKIWVVAVSND